LNVCYLEEKPSRDDEPFLKEEKKLLKSIAQRVGKIVEGKQAHDAVIIHFPPIFFKKLKKMRDK